MNENISKATEGDIGIPIPRYRKGDKVFWATTHREVRQHPCPDCLGSREWSVTTPGGTELKAECQRCGRGGWSNIPSLEYVVHTPWVKELTVGSIRVDTAAQVVWKDDVVEYMCVETGIGGGQVYGESVLFADKETAEQIATVEANSRTEKESSSAGALETKRVSYLRLKDAEIDAAQRATSLAGYFRERVQEIIEAEEGSDEYVTDDDLRSEIQSALRVEGLVRA